MALSRALGATLAVAFAAGLLAASSSAVPLPRPASDHTITTAHFVPAMLQAHSTLRYVQWRLAVLVHTIHVNACVNEKLGDFRCRTMMQ